MLAKVNSKSEQTVANILIIDDDEGILDYLDEVLSEKFQCFTACDFERFQDAYQQRPYNLILSDLNIGGTASAIDVLKHVNGKTPVIMMAGGSESSLQTKILSNLGCKALITKPINTETLFEMILDNIIVF